MHVFGFALANLAVAKETNPDIGRRARWIQALASFQEPTYCPLHIKAAVVVVGHPNALALLQILSVLNLHKIFTVPYILQ